MNILFYLIIYLCIPNKILITTPHAFSDELMRAKMGANATNENAAALPSPESSMNDDDLWNSLDT